MCLLGSAGWAQDLTLSSPPQGSAPFLGAPSRGLYRLGLALLQPIKLQPKLVSVTVWDMPSYRPSRLRGLSTLQITFPGRQAGSSSLIFWLREATSLQGRWWHDQISSLGSPHAPGPSHLPLLLA